MGLLELLIVILVIAWLVGGFAFPVGNAIHLLLVVVIILVIVRLARGERL